MRPNHTILLLLLLLPLAACSGSGDELLNVQTSMVDTTAGTEEIIDDVVRDEKRAEAAKRAALRTHDTVNAFYENVRKQRDELIHVMGREGVTKEDCKPILESLAKLRVQFRERLVDSWLLVRASMTPEEWVAFNTRIQASMDLD